MQYVITPNHRDNTFVYLTLNSENKIEWKYLSVVVNFKIRDASKESDICDEIRNWLTTFIHQKIILQNIEQRTLVDEELFDVVFFDKKPFQEYFPETSEYSIRFYHSPEYDY